MLAWSLVPAQIGDVWLFLVLGMLSAILVSVAKAGFGGSIGLLAVPMMIFACGGDPFLANGIMLPLLIACDYVSVVSWWGQWSWRPVAMLLPGVVAGIGVGWAILWAMRGAGSAAYSDSAKAVLMLAIGVIALGFVVLQTIRSLKKDPPAFRPVFWQGSVAGAAAGVTSTLAHAAGPITAMYLLPQKMPKGRYVATTVLYYWIGNQMKLVPYYALALINTKVLGAGLLLLPGIVGGALLGIFLHRKVGQKSFTGIVYVLLTVAAGKLIYSAVGDLWF